MQKRPRIHSITAGLVLVSVMCAGCATILGGGTNQAVSINAQPGAATYSIKAASGLEMGSGNVPAQVRLPRHNEYQVQITAAGYKPQTLALTKSLNGWVWGNLIFGWILGFGVDFIGGAAYKLEPALVTVNLQTAVRLDGSETKYAVVLLQDARGRFLQERWVELEALCDEVEGSRTVTAAR